MHFFKNKITKRLTVLIILYLTFLQTVLPLYFAEEFVLFLFYSLGLSLFFLLYNFKRVIIFTVLKKSTVLKKKYKFIILKKKNLKEKLFLNIILLLSFLINTHKRYKFFFYLLLLMSGMVNENFKFCVFICLNALFDFIYNHSLFQHVKKKIERDTIIYHTHWSEDTDLKVITKLLRLLFVLGLFIFIFSFTPPMFIGSHFLKLFPFTFDGYQFDLGVIQLVLAVHLIGPKILLFVFLVKLLCDIHIIFFRNSKTKYKMFALGGKVKIFFYVCGGLYCAVEGLEKVTIVLEKWQTLYNSKDLAQNYFRQTTQKWFQGIVRVSEGQEMAYTIMQNRNLKLNTKDIINPYTRVLDVDKLNYQLSLPCNVSEVQKLKPMDFKLLQCITLAKEEDVFRHNLSIVFGVARKEASIDSLICFFSKMEIENFMTSGKECASNLELHQNLKKLIQAISTTEEGRVVLERFISGKSPALFSILQETRSLDADLKQITMERLFQETVIIEDTSSLWLEEHKKSHPIKTFWGLTNEAKLLKEYEAIIRKTIIAFLPKRPA